MATTNVTPDVDTLSLDEIRKLAEEEARKTTTPSPEPQQPEAEVEEEETIEQPEGELEPKVLYAERSVDLGDGSGVQVFKGKGATREEALEDLADKQAEAHRNATKKIRELNAKVKATSEVKGPTKEEESLLAAEVITTPSQVVEKILKSRGIDLNELPTVVEEVKQTRALKQRKAVADQFVVNHPEFFDNDRNGQRLAKAVPLFGEFSLENLEKAYQDLSESGLLEVKGEEAGDGQNKDKPVTRIEPTTDNSSSQRTRRASGVSTHGRTAVRVSTEPTEDELYTMPLDELRKRANKQLSGQ